MKEAYLEIQAKSRYFSLGSLNAKTKFIWIVCHGYGQLAKYFIQKFSHLNLDENFIIAPEAMNRFYLEGFSGRVGASWMSSEDRAKDISNYCTQLNSIFEMLLTESNQAKFIFFGFSQGTATITRWMNLENKKCHHLILWGGRIAKEADAKNLNKLAKRTSIVFGLKDEFYSLKQVEDYLSSLKEMGLEFEAEKYNGKHALDLATIDHLRLKF